MSLIQIMSRKIQENYVKSFMYTQAMQKIYEQSKKKRTHMQPQRHKALIDDEATKDFIFSNHPLSGKTTNMRGT